MELPKEVYEYEKAEHELGQLRAVKEEAVIARKRKKKGKHVKRDSVGGTCEPTKKAKKRKPEDEVEQNKPPKRHKSEKSQKPDPKARSIANDSKGINDEPQTRKMTNVRSSPKSETTKIQAQRCKAVGVEEEHLRDLPDVRSRADMEAMKPPSESSKPEKVQRSFGAGVGAKDFQLYEEQSGQSNGQVSKDRPQQKRPLSNDWRKRFQRREVSAYESPKSCSCSELHPYFTEDPHRIPCMAEWSGYEPEFFEHLKQIVSCRGSLHPTYVVDASKKILKENDFAQGALSTNDQTIVNFGRAQSSNAPPDFYGTTKGKQRAARNVGSSSRHVPETRIVPFHTEFQPNSKEIEKPWVVVNERTPSNTLPMREKGAKATSSAAPVGPSTNSAGSHNRSTYLTSPNTSSLGMSHISPTGTHDLTLGSLPSRQENAAAKQIFETSLESSRDPHQHRKPFHTEPRRHQSVPASMHSRNHAVNERHVPPLPTPQRRDTALQEISNGAILPDLNRRIASLEKVIMERLPVTPQQPIATIQPVTAPAAGPAPGTAPAPTATPAAQNGDGAGQPLVRRKGKTREQQKLTKPELSRHVARHLRLPEERIIEIGRTVESYERHKAAPYAFSWSGRLYAKYHHLLEQKKADGELVWTWQQISRITR